MGGPGLVTKPGAHEEVSTTLTECREKTPMSLASMVLPVLEVVQKIAYACH